MELIPPAWPMLCAELFKTNEKFARQLWQHLHPSQALTFQLGLCEPHCVMTRDQLWNRLRHCFQDLLPPEDLLRASQRISPPDKTGRKTRMREALLFEQSVLDALNAKGEWDWRV